MIVLDTNIIIAILGGHAPSIALTTKLAGSEDLGVSIISVTEVYSGVRKSDLAGTRGALADLVILPFSEPAVAESAAQYRRDYALKTPDAIIAATCEFGAHRLITYDRDFAKLKKHWIEVLHYGG